MVSSWLKLDTAPPPGWVRGRLSNVVKEATLSRKVLSVMVIGPLVKRENVRRPRMAPPEPSPTIVLPSNRVLTIVVGPALSTAIAPPPAPSRSQVTWFPTNELLEIWSSATPRL